MTQEPLASWPGLAVDLALSHRHPRPWASRSLRAGASPCCVLCMGDAQGAPFIQSICQPSPEPLPSPKPVGGHWGSGADRALSAHRSPSLVAEVHLRE